MQLKEKEASDDKGCEQKPVKRETWHGAGGSAESVTVNQLPELIILLGKWD